MPSRGVIRAGHREEGTASVELIAAIPFLLLALLVAAQIALLGQALWSAEIAARAGARAAAVGESGTVAAKRALPPALRSGAEIEDEHGVSVRVPVPLLLPGAPSLKVETRSGLGVR